MQEEDPATLWPPTQAEQELVAPVEKVLEGHVSTPVLSALTFVPAAFVEQNAALEESENCPRPPQREQVEPSPDSPFEQAEHSVSVVFVQFEKMASPGLQVEQDMHEFWPEED